MTTERAALQEDLHAALAGPLGHLSSVSKHADALAGRRDQATTAVIAELAAALTDVTRLVDAYQRVIARRNWSEPPPC